MLHAMQRPLGQRVLLSQGSELRWRMGVGLLPQKFTPRQVQRHFEPRLQ